MFIVDFEKKCSAVILPTMTFLIYLEHSAMTLLYVTFLTNFQLSITSSTTLLHVTVLVNCEQSAVSLFGQILSIVL